MGPDLPMLNLRLCDEHATIANDALTAQGLDPSARLVDPEETHELQQAIQIVLMSSFTNVVLFLYTPDELERMRTMLCPICVLNSYDFSAWIGRAALYLRDVVNNAQMG